MAKGDIVIYSDDKTYRLSIFEAKELYYSLRDLFDPNFHPQRDGNSPVVKWDKGTKKRK